MCVDAGPSATPPWWTSLPVDPAEEAAGRKARWLVQPFWGDDAPSDFLPAGGQHLVLTATSLCQDDQPGGRAGLLCRVVPNSDAQGESGGGTPGLTFYIAVGAPLPLVPTHVPKMWGQEIWHSGVEARGTSKVALPVSEGSDSLVAVPLPLVELALGVARREPRSAVVLLKELDPFDHPYYGELYTEVHTKKSEVYIVTALGLRSCPGGVGLVKLGLRTGAGDWPTQLPEQRAQLGKVLAAFEGVRSRVDDHLMAGGYDFARQLRQGPQGVTDLESAKRRLVSPELCRAEQLAWQEATGYFALHELAVGDVVRVPTRTPHALQPGVRVVEFQTPDYERLILASNQKVMTQSHWDVEAGLAAMEGVAGQPPQDAGSSALAGTPGIERRAQGGGARSVQTLVSFEGLHVVRLDVTQAPSASGAQGSTVDLSFVRSAATAASPLSACHVIAGRPVVTVGARSWTLDSGKAYLLTAENLSMSCGGGEGSFLAVVGDAQSFGAQART